MSNNPVSIINSYSMVNVRNTEQTSDIIPSQSVEVTFNNSVGVIMGSKSDLPVMEKAINILKSFDIDVKVDIVSAHRTPEKMVEYGKNADKNVSVIIAGAGGAAHLPGMIASLTPLPVIGVPIKSSNSIDGWDSILSILQMPSGVPVATVALNGAENAGILAAKMLGIKDENIRRKIIEHKNSLKQKVMESCVGLHN
jgi:5-(carboxyamino)imidazole ribonucleotide mutase